MAQAEYMPNAIRDLFTDAKLDPSTNPARTVHAELAKLAGRSPQPIELTAHSLDQSGADGTAWRVA
jgi:hypothetical protein